MPRTDSKSSPFIVLRNGHAVPVDALRLLWALENRGLSIQLDHGDLLVGPRNSLNDADRAAIRAHKAELIALINTVEKEM